MLKFGLISQVDYTIGRARVWFDDIDIVSDWHSLPSYSTKGVMHCVRLAINTQVAVLMHRDGEQGVIIGAIWSQVDTPPAWANGKVEGTEYEDGDKFTHDSENHVFEFNGGELGGMVKAIELKTQLDKLTARVDGIINALTTSGVISGDGGSAYKTNITTALNMLTSKEDFSNIQNPKIKQ